MLRPQIRHDSLCTGTVRHRLNARDEAALLDDEFVVDGSCDCLGHGWEAKGTGWHQRGCIVSQRAQATDWSMPHHVAALAVADVVAESDVGC
jgi:hypothetical protein